MHAQRFWSKQFLLAAYRCLFVQETQRFESFEHHIIPTNSRGDYKLHEDDFDSANILLCKQ